MNSSTPPDAPEWVRVAGDLLGETIMLHAPGTIRIGVTSEGEMLITPSVVEIVGGSGDGERVFANFDFDVSGFARLFDEMPEISWTTGPEVALKLKGTVDGCDARITLLDRPLDTERVDHLLGPNGHLRDSQHGSDED